MSKLFIIPTPIGNLDDITQRAIQTLSEVDLIACEDTRHSSYLLNHYQIKTPTLSLHQHNESQKSQVIIEKIVQGQSVALISDAGTPLISDPGFGLVTKAQQAGIQVVPLPGACALICALSAAGLATDKFCFEGFLPAKTTARVKTLQALMQEPRTMVFYEAPHRLLDSLNDFVSVFSESRQTVVARELTKSFESIKRGTTVELYEFYQQNPDKLKGECVILLEGFVSSPQSLSEEAIAMLTVLLEDLPLKQAVKLAAKLSGESKNELYEKALSLKN